jgi:hypothetical protein
MSSDNKPQIPDGLKHGMNCAAWSTPEGSEVNLEDCTCGLVWRKIIAALIATRAQEPQKEEPPAAAQP